MGQDYCSDGCAMVSDDGEADSLPLASDVSEHNGTRLCSRWGRGQDYCGDGCVGVW
jgi:hypothetical protein